MKPLWHPLSTLVVPGLGCYASPNLIRMMLTAGGQSELLYGGDRMWPAVRNGQLVRIAPFSAGEARPGMLLVVLSGRIPDLLRIDSIGADGKLLLRGDADPDEPLEVGSEAVLARAQRSPDNVAQGLRLLRRLRMDLLEALRGAPDDRGGGDAAATIRHKYDSQAPYYAGSAREEIPGRLLERIGASIRPGGRLLVVGSGTGCESFALHEAGYEVSGVDFSPAMIEMARRTAMERDLEIDFKQADIRSHREPEGSLAGIFFTYDVYSFLPGSKMRSDLLRRMSAWLAPGGTIFLSARLVHRAYDRMLLTLQWLRLGSLQPTAWGRSHTRYLTSDGVFHRSFVHCFTLNRLQREVRAAGLSANAFHGGHIELSAPPMRR